jgi:predicted nucleic acid-binding protein
LRCTDADDQKFIDLACAAPARWLVSRDRAVLKLRRRAATDGLVIVTPDGWRLG